MPIQGWIAIISSFILASGGVSYGVIAGAARKQIGRVERKVNGHDVIIGKLSTQYAVIENELKHINEKLDNLSP
ncbi:hypothetical protein LCGC14_1196860 [marine sediment metagenome]|uniref:Uncharacterized protein n=1 Tax=marine sediment metagenome TaxID=412755 RepID=A0A0F9PMZ5_9ZZZZ